MKITKIEVCDFRGFPGPAVYDFDFGKSRSLFIYGENGSGKSSLFRAIEEFFNRGTGGPFTNFKNTRDPSLTSGHVTVHFDDGSAQAWKHGATRPLIQPPTSMTALQVGCLDYRSLLETNFTQRGDNVNLFDIAVRHLVPHLEVPVDGRSHPVSELWASVRYWNPAVKGHYRTYLRSCDEALRKFNTGFEPVIKPLIDKSTELLRKFPNPDFILGLSFHPVEYDKAQRAFKYEELILSVNYSGMHIPSHHNFLNEARLSAIGLVIYLAGLLISVPAQSPYPKLLVLDDVLVGLDMANRLPVLEILSQYFADWQIILLTYDRVWYEMLHAEIEAKHDWRAYELWLGADGVTPVHRHRGSGLDFFLSRALEYLAAGDDRAAALYARAAFEAKIKSYCEKKSVRVPYKRDPKAIEAEALWNAATGHALDNVPPADKPALQSKFLAITTARRVVLNPLSHAAPIAITRAEIQAAIDAVRDLTFPDIRGHVRP
ncbi:MAG TPA: AAA family ATPase [Bryobacteraceae bacterium]